MKKPIYALLAAFAASLLLVSIAAASDPDLPMKWSQPPVQATDAFGNPIYFNNEPVYLGWDEISWYDGEPPYQKLYDDWLCTDQNPVTDIHWWGSYLDWMEPYPYDIKPSGFWFGIYTDIPKDPQNPESYSYPGELLWEYSTLSYLEEFVGYDMDPFNGMITDSTFQYTVLLPQDKWFYQPGQDTVLWLSIQAMYDGIPPSPYYGWGWKTRPHYFNDDFVYSTNMSPTGYYPLEPGFDLAFELSTVPEPGGLLALGAGLFTMAGWAIRGRRKR